MKTYLVIGENERLGEKLLFSDNRCSCLDWIWENCDIGDLYTYGGNRWSGTAYYEENNTVYEIQVDKFYE